METLKDVKLSLSEEDRRIKKRDCLLILQLSTLQTNLINEIEHIYRKNGMYKMNIKHWHKQIKSLISQSRNDGAWENMTPEQWDICGRMADDLEHIILSWADGKKITIE